jgi:hypothetical protein
MSINLPVSCRHIQRYGMVILRSIYLQVLLLCLLCGCGGGGGSGSASLVKERGQFIDSAVEGLSYKTLSQSGVTDADGGFDFVKGEQVTFSFGSITFPIAQASVIVTPVNMAPGNNADSNEATNVAYLLQALDTDGVPANGIKIPSALEKLATEAVNFSLDPASFVALPQVKTLVDEAAKLRVPSVPPTTTDSATAHLSSTLRGLLDNRMMVLGTMGCGKPNPMGQRQQMSTALWASLNVEPKDGWFYNGTYTARTTRPQGALIPYKPVEGSLEMQMARLSGDWDDTYSAVQDRWYQHVENKKVVVRIAARKNPQETSSFPAYVGAAIYLHYVATDQTYVEVELEAGDASTAYFSFTGINPATYYKAVPEDSPIAKMHWGGTTPEGRQLGGYSCLVAPGGAVLLWRRPSGRSDLFFSPDSQSNEEGTQVPVYETGKGYAGGAGIRSGVKKLSIVR